jgi:CrcB protein
MIKILLILSGGAIGSLGRYMASGLAHQFTSSIFPVGTLAVNLIGSFLIGLLWGIFENTMVSPNVRSFIFIGILGGFTTFSSYSLETLNLLRDGELKLAFANFALNNFLGLGLALAGFALAKQFQ